MIIAIIDADMVAFRCAASAEEAMEEYIPRARCDYFINNILTATECDEHELWLSGPNNFRYKVYPEYKGNRRDNLRPKWESFCKEYLKDTWEAKVIDGAEADDALGYRCSELGASSVCVTNDKDLKQIAGKHYDPVKELSFTITPEAADRFFYYQLLVGDGVDNLKGVPGIGKVKAERILQQAEKDRLADIEDNGLEQVAPIQEYYKDAVLMEYSCEEEFEMQAKCLWIWREKGGIWTNQHGQQVG